MFATHLSWSFLSTGQLSHYHKLEFSTECSSGHLASPSLCCSSQYTSQIGRFDLTCGLVERVQSNTGAYLLYVTYLPILVTRFYSSFHKQALHRWLLVNEGHS